MTDRIESAKRAWELRRTNEARVAAWYEQPTCLCGCGEALVRHRDATKQKLFRPGHDARLKSAAATVLAGASQRDAIPETARILKRRIGFLKTRPELEKAFSS